MLIFEQFTTDDVFSEILAQAPEGLQETFEQLKNTPQHKEHHPEGDVYTHIQIVTNRLHRHYGDINLTMAGFFHDVGKLTATVWNDKKKKWGAPGHEKESAREIARYADWIKSMGADPSIVEAIVSDHMRVKLMDEMRPSKKEELMSRPHIFKTLQFNKADYGGTSMNLQ